MELLLSPLFSGSSGNAVYVGAGRTGILVDAGVSCARVVAEMKASGIDPAALSGILITHEHSDHVAGAGILSRKFDLPIYATEGTWNAMAEKLGAVSAKNIRVIESGQDFYIGDLDISPFPLPHDAADPCGYAFTCGRLRAAIATDIGCLREGWLKAVSGCELVLLESNYDPGMLKAGRYPYALKTRILGTKGHLSNEDAGRAACRLVESGVRSLILGHLSRENNFPELALETVRLALTDAGVKVGTDAELTVASRDHASGMFAVRDGFDLIRRA